MKTPESLLNAVDCGIIEEVVRPLMSGKEAQVYVVVAGGDECVAKVYKEASQRTFKHRAQYTEGRRTRNTRDQRAMSKRSQHGRSQDEAGWRSTEAHMIRRLRDAGVRVPELMNFVDGVLVMELVQDAEGDPAPRLGDLSFTASEARKIYEQLLREVSRMLCAGVIHGDLSEFNVLMGAHGPVLIDFPQSVGAASNQSARNFLLRDVENLHRFVERYSPDPSRRAYAEEMWSLYEAGRLEPDTELRGDYRAPEGKADTEDVLALIEDADREEYERREARGEDAPEEAPRPLRTVVDFTKQAKPRSSAGRRAKSGRSVSTKARRSRTEEKPATAQAAAAEGEAAPKKRRNRRRRKRSTTTGGTGDAETMAGSSARSRTPAEKKPTGSGEAKPSRRRRRGARAGTRSDSGKTKAGSPGHAERPAKPPADPRDGSRSAAGADGVDRPARRRRRRPRSTGSRKST
jgi:RIO kinase 1